MTYPTDKDRLKQFNEKLDKVLPAAIAAPNKPSIFISDQESKILDELLEIQEDPLTRVEAPPEAIAKLSALAVELKSRGTALRCLRIAIASENTPKSDSLELYLSKSDNPLATILRTANDLTELSRVPLPAQTTLTEKFSELYLEASERADERGLRVLAGSVSNYIRVRSFTETDLTVEEKKLFLSMLSRMIKTCLKPPLVDALFNIACGWDLSTETGEAFIRTVRLLDEERRQDVFHKIPKLLVEKVRKEGKPLQLSEPILDLFTSILEAKEMLILLSHGTKAYKDSSEDIMCDNVLSDLKVGVLESGEHGTRREILGGLSIFLPSLSEENQTRVFRMFGEERVLSTQYRELDGESSIEFQKIVSWAYNRAQIHEGIPLVFAEKIFILPGVADQS